MITNILLFGGLSWMEMAVIIGAVLLFFGANRIPELMRGLGSGVKEFKKGLKDEDLESEKEKKKK